MVLKKIKVLVVDDALMMRSFLRDMISQSEDFEVIGSAHNGKMAVEKVKELKPDVITLDVEMPIMDGIQACRKIMAENPTPIIMVSSITYEGGKKTLEALEAGAFDFIQKPKAQKANSLKEIQDDLFRKLKTAYSSRFISKLRHKATPQEAQVEVQSLSKQPKKVTPEKLKNSIIAIGISTGGPPCITKIFQALPAYSPPVVVVQHMPEGFTKAMAERIDKVSQMTVSEAREGDILEKGKGYIAPGDAHLQVTQMNGVYKCHLSRKLPVSGHRPSVDCLFESVAKVYGDKAIGIIMTGMGRDGAKELKTMRDLGAHTIAQDEASCTVFGMPKAAINDGAADEILSLDGIILRLRRLIEKIKGL